MTSTTHTWSAWVLGTPDRKLGARAASIALDDTVAPHVQATLEVSIPDAAMLGLIDPRDRKRIRIDSTSVSTFGATTRSFNLGIRRRRVKHKGAVMTLALASDEAMLDDWAPLANDTVPYTFQFSLRGLIGYVLHKAIPGTVLSGTTPDMTVNALISSVNVVRNPRAKSDLTDWSSSNSISRQTSGGPAGAPTWVNCQSASAGQLLVNYSADGVPLQAGKRYRVGVWQNAAAGVMIAFDGLVQNAAGATLLDLIETPVAATGGWWRAFTTFTAPAGATKMVLRSFTTGSVPAGTSLNTTGWRVSEVTDDPTDNLYFDGDTASTSEYAYAYSGATSTRTALIDRASDLLTWRAGTSALAFLAPILQTFGLRLVCDEARVWTLRTADYVAGGSLTIRTGINLVDGEDEVSRDDTEFCDAAVVRYQWRDLAGTQQERVDSFALVSPATQVRRIERTTPYPGPGFAEYVVRRSQGRGRQVTVTTMADWAAMAEQPSEFTLMGAPVQLGKTSRVEFDLNQNTMTVTSRTTDTVIGAIDLLPGVIDNLTGTIDSL